MSESIRRLVSDKPVKSSEADRARIAADGEAYLAAGNKIDVRGVGETNLINGVQRNLVTAARKGNIKGREARWGKR